MSFSIGVFMSAAGLVAAFAQSPVTVLQGVYTQEQAARGEAVYNKSCGGCHEGQDADGPLLTGRLFLDRWREDTLEPLYAFIATNMPGNNPGGLDPAAYTDVMAFVLESNGFPPGMNQLRADTMASIQLIGPDGPRPLSNLTIVRVVGCLSPAANTGWALTRAGRPHPVRTRVVNGATPDELKNSAAQPLGVQTFPLMSVTPQGATLAGNKVQVTGVLTRQGSVERINVMSLSSVASACGE